MSAVPSVPSTGLTVPSLRMATTSRRRFLPRRSVQSLTIFVVAGVDEDVGDGGQRQLDFLAGQRLQLDLLLLDGQFLAVQQGAVDQLDIGKLLGELDRDDGGEVDLEDLGQRRGDAHAPLGEDDFLVRDALQVAFDDIALEGVQLGAPAGRGAQEQGEERGTDTHGQPHEGASGG